MKRKRRTPEQVIALLRDAGADLAAGLSIERVCTKLGVSRQTWQNGCAESFHARLRDELLEQGLWASAEEAKLLSKRWSWEYNHERPLSALGYRTPAEYAALAPTLVAAGTQSTGRPIMDAAKVRVSASWG